MDVDYIFSQSSLDQEDYKQSISSQNQRDNASTDIQRKNNHKFMNKTKNIKKKYYQPIQQCGKIYLYEDDPEQYKKIRKLSARRVRGRKQNAFGSLQQEVQYLRNMNSQLQLNNARLETQNKNLKEQIDFMRGLVSKSSTNIKPEPIQKFISPQTFTDKSQTHEQSDYQSPFLEQQSDWLRLPNRRSSSNMWTLLGVFTLVLTVFVLPSQTGISSPTILLSLSGEKTQQKVGLFQIFIKSIFICFDYAKIIFKYCLILAYIWFAYQIGKKYINKKKIKKI